MGSGSHNQSIWKVWLKLIGLIGVGVALLLAGLIAGFAEELSSANPATAGDFDFRWE